MSIARDRVMKTSRRVRRGKSQAHAALTRATRCTLERLEDRTLFAVDPTTVGGDIAFSTFTGAADRLALNGTATITASGELQLTKNAGNQGGTAYYCVPEDVADGFDAGFDF